MDQLPPFCGQMWVDVWVHGYNSCKCEEEAESTKESVSKEWSSYKEFSAELCSCGSSSTDFIMLGFGQYTV